MGTALKRRGVNWQLVSAIILALTMIFVGWQAYETRRTTKLLRRNLELQNQPLVLIEEATVKYDKDSKAIRNRVRLKCFGQTPAHEYVRTRDLIFWVDANKQEFQAYLANKEDDGAVQKYHAYFREISKAVLDFFEKSPNATKENLNKYLDTLRSEARKITITVAGIAHIVLTFDNPFVFEEVKEYELFTRTILAPDSTLEMTNGRSVNEDILKPVWERSRILFYYTAVECEGLQKGEKLRTYYLGHLGGFGDIKKSERLRLALSEDRAVVIADPEKTVENPSYLYNVLRVWGTRVGVPD